MIRNPHELILSRRIHTSTGTLFGADINEWFTLFMCHMNWQLFHFFPWNSFFLRVLLFQVNMKCLDYSVQSLDKQTTWFLLCFEKVFWALNWPIRDRERQEGSEKREKNENSMKLPQQIVHLWNIWVVNFFPPYYLRSKSIETDSRILAQPFFCSSFFVFRVFYWIVWLGSMIYSVVNLSIE